MNNSFQIWHWHPIKDLPLYVHASYHPKEKYWDIAKELTSLCFNVIVTPEQDLMYVDDKLFSQR